MKIFPDSKRVDEKPVGKKKLEAPNSFLLVYPNSYYLGMSNLGYHTIISLVDNLPEWYAERAFLGFERSLEKKKTFSSFDVVAFSVSYELDYLNLPRIFQAGKIPLRSDRRDRHHPLIMAGGTAVSINPEPIADFVDIMVIGDGEKVLERILYRLTGIKAAPRRAVLEGLSDIQGVYIPRFHRSRLDRRARFSALVSEKGEPARIERNRANNLEDSRSTSCYLTRATVFPRRGLIEITRGCRWQCRFCVTGYLSRPVRDRSVETIAAIARGLSSQTRLLGLISPSVSDHPRIGEIVSNLVEEGFLLSVSSLRAETVSEDLIRALARSGQKEITLAPEAGTTRLRKVINKNIPDDSLICLLKKMRGEGLSRAKLYFLVGLPGENRKDIEGIVTLSRRLAGFLPLRISVSPFVPKPQTPFQWAALDSYESLQTKLKYLKSELNRIKGVKVKTGSAREAIRQAYLSCGDRRMAGVIEKRDFCRMEQPESIFRIKERDESFPWSFIAGGSQRELLWNEYLKAKEGIATPSS